MARGSVSIRMAQCNGRVLRPGVGRPGALVPGALCPGVLVPGALAPGARAPDALCLVGVAMDLDPVVELPVFVPLLVLCMGLPLMIIRLGPRLGPGVVVVLLLVPCALSIQVEQSPMFLQTEWVTLARFPLDPTQVVLREPERNLTLASMFGTLAVQSMCSSRGPTFCERWFVPRQPPRT